MFSGNLLNLHQAKAAWGRSSMSMKNWRCPFAEINNKTSMFMSYDTGVVIKHSIDFIQQT